MPNNDELAGDTRESGTPIKVVDVLAELRQGFRTKYFLQKYSITLPEFEELLKHLIRKGLFTKEEFRTWKQSRANGNSAAKSHSNTAGTVDEHDGSKNQQNVKVADTDGNDQNEPETVHTFVINDPERHNSWALQLFSTPREKMRGAKFKINLQGKKYLFQVEDLVFRGNVSMHPEDDDSPESSKSKREEAMNFIAVHGWAAYLESRAIAANVLMKQKPQIVKKARLVVLHCRNNTYLAALHTPVPAINFYVGNSMENLKLRLAKSIDVRTINNSEVPQS
jgi:hypothetical protein